MCVPRPRISSEGRFPAQGTRISRSGIHSGPGSAPDIQHPGTGRKAHKATALCVSSSPAGPMMPPNPLRGQCFRKHPHSPVLAIRAYLSSSSFSTSAIFPSASSSGMNTCPQRGTSEGQRETCSPGKNADFPDLQGNFALKAQPIDFVGAASISVSRFYFLGDFHPVAVSVVNDEFISGTGVFHPVGDAAGL